jgi:hypothetical protein
MAIKNTNGTVSVRHEPTAGFCSSLLHLRSLGALCCAAVARALFIPCPSILPAGGREPAAGCSWVQPTPRRCRAACRAPAARPLPPLPDAGPASHKRDALAPSSSSDRLTTPLDTAKLLNLAHHAQPRLPYRTPLSSFFCACYGGQSIV